MTHRTELLRLVGWMIREIPLDEISKRIAYVSQDNYLFDMSIMENIRLGRRDASDEEVIRAAKSTGSQNLSVPFRMGMIPEQAKAADIFPGENGKGSPLPEPC